MSRVCVTGAAGYIAAWLVGKLLQRGCIVHATLRSLLDEEKTAVLTVLPGAAERLTLFEADIYNATTFEPAIQGCEFVFLVATPLMHDNSSTKAYVASKSLSEQELLRHNESEGGRAFEVVTLACGLVGGDTLHPVLSSRMSSVTMVVAALTGNEIHHNALCFMQALLGSAPLVHIDDACAAHLFCMDQPSMAGRFLCAAGYPTMQDYVARFAAKYPEHKIILKELAGEGVRVPGDSSKLVELGFRFKYSVEETLDCSVECAKRMGEL
ncbi:hypothetical protein CFC21_069380 [Triticum aestivum]|uniref:NAD-dependent epimerase/dehydratase domain-containing protein n=2 Tax=Triticum aestivum TaxID=4565 RepID=A0A9R1HC83_WHEAT|nr:hypothetical protein CFC21_069380 [Triticum aestivum]